LSGSLNVEGAVDSSGRRGCRIDEIQEGQLITLCRLIHSLDQELQNRER
jgi:hypothetical protein